MSRLWIFVRGRCSRLFDDLPGAQSSGKSEQAMTMRVEVPVRMTDNPNNPIKAKAKQCFRQDHVSMRNRCGVSSTGTTPRAPVNLSIERMGRLITLLPHKQSMLSLPDTTPRQRSNVFQGETKAAFNLPSNPFGIVAARNKVDVGHPVAQCLQTSFLAVQTMGDPQEQGVEPPTANGPQDAPCDPQRLVVKTIIRNGRNQTAAGLELFSDFFE